MWNAIGCYCWLIFVNIRIWYSTVQLQRVMVFLWLEWSQTPLILCLIPSLESGVQGVGMGYGITGPDDQQACTMRHSQKLGRISTGVWGKYWEQVYRRSQSPGCGGHQREGSDSNQSFPIFLVSPNTHTHTHTHHTHTYTHTHTHTHTSHMWIPLLVAPESWNHVVHESAEFMLLRPRESQKILVTSLVAGPLSLVICHLSGI